jgi:hypothetical protein
MRAEDLRDYIHRFREWIDLEAAPVLHAEQAEALACWRDELVSAERLLEGKPELPIAFLGPSQQGKSSLINALLGENILAVGGAVGACTCVITTIHHHETSGYRAEIDFITLQEWQNELTAITDSISTESIEDETAEDRAEKEALLKAAQEKMDAVYGSIPDGGLLDLLTDGKLGLPQEIAEFMVTRTPLVIAEDNALTLRNRVRRYLVGRDQHADAQFWPLISRVRIYGNFEVLSNGVVLVDLPGLNDPNPAREHVTKNYLKDARHLWLVCNCQTGIDRVFTQVLRDDGLLFRLFLEGRLDAFAVIGTRVDDMNFEAVLTQMGLREDDFDGDSAPLLKFRRAEILKHVRDRLSTIAHEIVTKAARSHDSHSFLRRVRSIPVFSVSTSAYLHAQGRMPLYQGMKISADQTQIPLLIKHLHSVTLEQNYQSQVAVSLERLRNLRSQVRRFFLDRIRHIELATEEARQEWNALTKLCREAIEGSRSELVKIEARAHEAMHQRCGEFERRLKDLDANAVKALQNVFKSWEAINWRSLHAAARLKGVWFSRSLQHEINLNRDIARAYLDLLPFVWDEFFGAHLRELSAGVAEDTRMELHKTAERLRGAMNMLRHQPAEIAESVRTSVQTAGESFRLQTGEVHAALQAHIQRTRQMLSDGMVEAASAFMQAAYSQARADPGGAGIKRRMLQILSEHARQHAPALFIEMRRGLSEGVAQLQASMRPQLSRIVQYGIAVLDQFSENVAGHSIASPGQRKRLSDTLALLPGLDRRTEPAVPNNKAEEEFDAFRPTDINPQGRMLDPRNHNERLA